jgi:hypothetical protein
LFTESGQLFTESGQLFTESGQLFTEPGEGAAGGRVGRCGATELGRDASGVGAVHANCSLNQANCSLNQANCSLNQANCSLNQVKALLAAGSDVAVRLSSGETPLVSALFMLHKANLKLTMGRRQRPDAARRLSTEQKHAAAQVDNYQNIIRALLAAGADTGHFRSF